jgi:hypothetical protein
MDVRQFHLYIDGRRLPRWFLRNEDTQVCERTFMRCDGSVERFEYPWTGVDEPAVVYDPLEGAPFAQLDGHALCFLFRPADGGYVSMRLATQLTDCEMTWQVQGEGNDIMPFAEHATGHWWRLDSGETYVIHLDCAGVRTRMTVKYVRCREPLLDLSRALLNRV